MAHSAGEALAHSTGLSLGHSTGVQDWPAAPLAYQVKVALSLGAVPLAELQPSRERRDQAVGLPGFWLGSSGHETTLAVTAGMGGVA